MDIKLQAAIGFSILFFCSFVFAEQLLLGPVYTDVEDELSFIITFPQGTEITPKANDFKLLENTEVLSSADEIQRLNQSNKEFVLLFCIDVSGSMKKKVLKEIQDALVDLLTTARKENKYGLISFADKVKTESKITNDRPTLIEYITNLKITGKKTVLFQAIFKSLDSLEQLEPNTYRRILVISDGKNENSDSTFITPDSIINLSKKYGIPIDAIGRGRIDEQYSEGLRGLANATGGRFILADPNSTSLKEAITRMHKMLVEKTWIVRFPYQANTEGEEVTNAVLKFEQNHTYNFSSTIAQSIPRPIITGETDYQKKMILIFGFILLLLTTLIFILWLFKRRKPPKPGHVHTEPKIDQGPLEETPPHIIPPVRHTAVGAVSSSKTDQSLPEISLQGIMGPLEGQTIQIDQHPFQIGANQENNLVLSDDEFISGAHLSLSYSNDKLLLSDLDSLNGTLLNGQEIHDQTVQVFPEDEIRIGNSCFKVMEF